MILVADDNADNRHILVFHLRRLGVRSIEEAADGESAINAFSTTRPSLVFIDLAMKPTDGWEAVRRMSPRLPALTGQEVLAILYQHGFVQLRQSGSHVDR